MSVERKNVEMVLGAELAPTFLTCGSHLGLEKEVAVLLRS